MSPRKSEPGAAKPEMNPMVRFYKTPTRKGAIHAKRCECIGVTAVEQGNGQRDHLERGFCNQIRNCIAARCPLFRHSAMHSTISDFEKARQLYAPSIAARLAGEPL